MLFKTKHHNVFATTSILNMFFESIYCTMTATFLPKT